MTTPPPIPTLTPPSPPSEVPRGLLICIGMVILLHGAWAGQAFLVPMLLSALLAFTAVPLVRLLNRWRFPDWLAIACAAVVLLLPLGLVAVALVKQLQSLIADYPALIASLEKTLRNLSNQSWARHLGIAAELRTDALTERLSHSAGEGLQLAAHGLRTLLEVGSQWVLIFLFAIFMLASRRHLNTAFEKIFSRWEGVEGRSMLRALTELIEKFLLAKLLVVILVALVSAVVLWIAHVPYAFLLGVMVGVLTLLPEVGFLVSLVPILAVALAFSLSTWNWIGAIVAMIVIHLIEANILTPKLVGHKLNLNALATFVGLFAGGLLWGVWGMFLSVPILGVIRIALSVSPTWAPWGELLAERDDSEVIGKLVSRRLRSAWENALTLPWRRAES